MASKKEVATKKSGGEFGASGFTLGVLSIPFAGYFGVVIGIVGLVFCVIQQKKKKTSLGKWGIVLNIVGLVLSVAFIIYLGPLINQMMQVS
jgi:hypothetical protein